MEGNKSKMSNRPTCNTPMYVGNNKKRSNMKWICKKKVWSNTCNPQNRIAQMGRTQAWRTDNNTWYTTITLGDLKTPRKRPGVRWDMTRKIAGPTWPLQQTTDKNGQLWKTNICVFNGALPFKGRLRFKQFIHKKNASWELQDINYKLVEDIIII